MNRWSALATASFIYDGYAIAYVLVAIFWSWARRIQMSEISIGYGPRLTSFRLGTANVVFRLSFLGSSIRHTTRNPPSDNAELQEQLAPGMRLFEELSPWEKIGLALTGPSTIMILCTLLLGTRAFSELRDGFGQWLELFAAPRVYGAPHIRAYLQMIGTGQLREATGVLGAKMVAITLFPFIEFSAGGLIVSELLKFLFRERLTRGIISTLQMISLLVGVVLFVIQIVAIVSAMMGRGLS